MRKGDVIPLILYAVLTAFVVYMIDVYLVFIEEALAFNAIFLAIGTAIAILLFVGLLFRWLFTTRLGHAWSETINALEEAGRRLMGGSDQPVTREELRQTVVDLGGAVRGLYPYVKITLAALLFVGLTVELMAIATGAVMYLQVQRLEEQNT